MDAIHIATSIYYNCDIFLTNDAQLKQVSEANILLVDDMWEMIYDIEWFYNSSETIYKAWIVPKYGRNSCCNNKRKTLPSFSRI